ncbi:MAG: quinone-dependent dihydroorotate dehydrogenase [Proteobacteria bacterium]|jgi:dihydroorotate dehydrogenase|nr:quinone-dependent dihydroorotate dehydrogenase [Pseudomonadota bacterium]
MNSWLKWLPPSWAHGLAPVGLGIYTSFKKFPTREWRSFEFAGVRFPNPLGIPGGMDKNGTSLETWKSLGAGFIEVGTVTPYAQKGNPGTVIDRDWHEQLLWNKLGFPSHGSDDVFFNLKSQKSELKIPLFVNIGKNRTRPNEEAEVDYIYLADRFSEVADALVVNVSSPNTLGLRDLQKNLNSWLKKVIDASRGKPVLVKLSPDLSQEDLFSCLDQCEEAGCAGFILTNTTSQRPGGSKFPVEGGLSGKILTETSRNILKKSLLHLGPRKNHLLVVSVGGILTPEEALARLDLGADLVQTYSGLVFYGPQFFEDTYQREAQNRNIEQRVES